MSIEVPEGLLDRILSYIRKEQRLSVIKRRVAVFSALTLSSAAGFLPVFKIAQAGLSESGFLQFFSLIFSDFGTVIAYWQNFAMSLLETFPVMEFIFLFSVVFAFLMSLKFLAHDIKYVFNPRQLIIS